MNQMNNALYVKPYDAGAASEGTPRTPTHGIPSPLHSPGPAPSVDGAAAMPIIDVDSMASDVAYQWRRCGPGSGSVSAGSLSGEGQTASGAEARDRERSPGRGPLNDHHMIV